MNKKNFTYKILEIKKKDIGTKTPEKIYNLIKNENTYSILAQLSKVLILEYLMISILSKKIFLFAIKKKQEVVGYILYAKKEKDLIVEFEKIKFKILIHLILNFKIFSIINIFLAITKLDILLANFSIKKNTINTINLNLLAIKSIHQSKGLGKILIEKTLKKLSNKGLKFNYVSCEAPTRRALKFYKRNKFYLIGKKIRLFKNLYLLKKKIK